MLPPDVKTDGIGLIPTLLGRAGQKAHDFLYWESPAGRGAQAVRLGDWKGVKVGVKRDRGVPLQLFDLRTDPAESRDVAAQQPAVVEKVERAMREGRTESPVFPLLAAR